MFWRFGFHNSAAIDSTLEKEGLTLQDLFEEEDLLQECKSHNNKLIDYLCKVDVLKQLTDIMLIKNKPPSDVIEEEEERNKRYKYAYYACEVLCCEVFAICDAFVSNIDLLAELWKILESPPPLDIAQISYFAKANMVFLEKKPVQMINYIKSKPNILSNLLNHISNSGVSGLLLKLISIEEVPEAHGIIEWLRNENLIIMLLDRFNPELDSLINDLASQLILDIIAVSYQTSSQIELALMDPTQVVPAIGGNVLIEQLKSEHVINKLVDYMVSEKNSRNNHVLINGINIIIELMRRYCSEIEQAEYQQHHHQIQTHKFSSNPVSLEKLKALATDPNGLLRVLGTRINEFIHLLSSSRTNKEPVMTSIGLNVPLGCERLKICELFAEILHLQYLYTSSPLFDKLILTSLGKNGTTNDVNVADELVSISESFVNSKILPICLNTYTFFTMAANTSVISTEKKHPIIEEKMMFIKKVVRTLVISIYQDGQLTTKITNAQRQNDYELEQPKGVRLGYMGHLTYISEEVCKLMEKCSADLKDDLNSYFQQSTWEDYLSGVYRETKERDHQALGGERPNAPPTSNVIPGVTGIQNGVIVDELNPTQQNQVLKKNLGQNAEDSDDEEDLDKGEICLADGDFASDQFARYLCQQIVNDFPTGFSFDEEEEEADADDDLAEWKTGLVLDTISGFEIDQKFPERISSLDTSDVESKFSEEKTI
ncbi:hypothetical protein HDU92_003814 [Lobulomyces angularis]|nr:hypothetical protein HDU92_003814 [Lobulomyces angularis]